MAVQTLREGASPHFAGCQHVEVYLLYHQEVTSPLQGLTAMVLHSSFLHLTMSINFDEDNDSFVFSFNHPFRCCVL